MTKEKSKILKQLAIATKNGKLLEIKHKGARRSLIFRAIRKAIKIEIPKIELRSVPIKENGKIIGYL